MTNETIIQNLIAEVQGSKKYRDLDLPAVFLKDLIDQELNQTQNKRLVKENFRKKLHEVIAPYLEDIDYLQETKNLQAMVQTLSTPQPDDTQIKHWATCVMKKHASTRERLTNLTSFYNTIWQHISRVSSILDLACALDPLALPWFDNPHLDTFYAIDIHKPRLDFLGMFFETFFPFAKAIQQDFIASPVRISADCAFLFKEAHRLEKRKPGSTHDLIQNLQVRHVVITLPASDLRGHHSLLNYHNKLIEKWVTGLNVTVNQAQVGTELLYFIEKAETQ